MTGHDDEHGWNASPTGNGYTAKPQLRDRGWNKGSLTPPPRQHTKQPFTYGSFLEAFADLVGALVLCIITLPIIAVCYLSPIIIIGVPAFFLGEWLGFW